VAEVVEAEPKTAAGKTAANSKSSGSNLGGIDKRICVFITAIEV